MVNRIVDFLSKYKLLHFLYWAWAVLGLYHDRLASASPQQTIPPFTTTILVVIPEALSVYTCIYLLIPRLLTKGKIISFLLFCVLACVFYGFFGFGIMWLYAFLLKGHGIKHMLLHVISNTVDNVIATAIFVSIVTLAAKSRSDRRDKQLEKEKLLTELNFLKAQINPHFLFNALNSIYVLIDIDQKMAGDTLLKFSGMLRYQLYECGHSLVEVDKELKFLSDYIGMEQTRRSDSLELITDIPEAPVNFAIAPFLLIPFVENAFKFVSRHADAKNYIHITVSVTNGTFSFIVVNSCEPATHTGNKEGGIGIQNVKRRLELLYPGKHQLHITAGDQVYRTQLILHATENELYHHG